MGEGLHFKEIVSGFQELVSQEIVVSFVRFVFAVMAFLTVHFVFYVQFFDGSMLMIYPASFMFDFSFVLLAHVAVGFSSGVFLMLSRPHILLLALCQSRRLRRFPLVRACILFAHRLERSFENRLILTTTLGAFIFLHGYVGVLLGSSIFLFLLTLFGVLSSNSRHRIGVSFLGLGKAKRESRSVKEVTVNFVRMAFSDPLEIVAAFFRFSQEFIGVLSRDILAAFENPKSMQSAAVILLLFAAISGYFRGLFVEGAFEFELLQVERTSIGVVVASSSEGILFYNKLEERAHFIPAATFEIIGSKP